MTTRHGSADYGDKFAAGMFRRVANGPPAMQDETAGWLKPTHKMRDGARWFSNGGAARRRHG
jgi:hypothetical protein